MSEREYNKKQLMNWLKTCGGENGLDAVDLIEQLEAKVERLEAGTRDCVWFYEIDAWWTCQNSPQECQTQHCPDCGRRVVLEGES
jgi:hypothetical protein